MRNLFNLFALAGLAVLSTGAAVFAANQPQWGQCWTRNMVSSETGLPDSFDPATGANIRWSVALGTQSYATPIVAGGCVFIGTNNGSPRDPAVTGDRGVLMCFDEQTGVLHWQLLCLKLTNSIYWDWPNDGLCSPATIESNRVYLVTNRGEVLCLPLIGPTNSITETAALWRFDIINQCGVRQHDSAHASPLLDGRFLYINTSNGVDDSHTNICSPNAASLIVLDKTTGQLVAHDAEHIGPDIFHCTWSSPARGEVNGRRLIFFAGGNGVVYAFEPVRAGTGEIQTLKKVWQFDFDPAAPKENIHTYLRNRQQSPSNIYSLPVFHHNRLYVSGGGDMFWGKRQAWLKCIDAAQGRELWSYPLAKHTISTPAVVNGLVFVADVGHFLHCVDADTGQAYWTHDLNGEVWASPLVADGKVFIGTRKSDFFIFAAAKEKNLLSSVKLDSPIAGTATAANRTLFIATMKRLYAVAKTLSP